MKEGTDNTPHGIGIRVYYGDIFEGYWKDGKLHGRGRRIWGNGNYYIGEFKEGQCDGEGTFYQNGDKFKGRWDGKRNGQGKINYTDGKKYIGKWVWHQNKFIRHGLGTLYSADEKVLNQGKWYRDKYFGKK